MKKRIISIFLSMFLLLWLPTIVGAADKIYAPFNWSCFSDGGLLHCKKSATIEVEVKKYSENVYCAKNESVCWEIDTGLAWTWLGSETPILNPDSKKEEEYSVKYWDIKSNFEKFPSYQYESSWELKSGGKVTGIWDFELTTNGNTCPEKDGLIGDFYEDDGKKYCYYAKYVSELNNGKCNQIAGVSGDVQTFLGKSYCIYNLYGYEKNDCNKNGSDGKYLSGYETCIRKPGSSSTDKEYNGEIRCFDSAGKGYKPNSHNGGQSGNLNHFYYFCPVEQNILGDLSTCFEYEFLEEADVIKKFGEANKGYKALYCKTAIKSDSPNTPEQGTLIEENEYIEENNDLDIKINFAEGCGIFSNSIKEWLTQALDIIKIIALVLTIILGMLDFFKGVASGSADAMKKMWKNFSTRLIVVVILFLLPVIIEFLLGLVTISGIDSSNPLCGIK